MVQFLWILSILGAVVGCVALVSGLASANGAPQEAAAGAIAVAFAVIPFCIARAAEGIVRQNQREAQKPTHGDSVI